MARQVTIRYFEGCPNWKLAVERVQQALDQIEGPPIDVALERVETDEDAERRSFRGSPTVLVDGQDPFGDPASPIGLSCRIYRTERGAEGAPSVRQLITALGSL